MTYKIISTGSKGNAVIINNNILIDCGVYFRAIQPYYKDLKLVLLTHIHSDHFKPRVIKTLAELRPTLRFACGEWLVTDLVKAGVNKKNIDVVEIGKLYDYGIFKITPIKLYHNVPNCGYRIFVGDEKCIYATDTDTLEGIQAKGYNLYMLEANYTEDGIQERIQAKREQGIFSYEHSVIQNHLSKEKCDDFIYQNIEEGGEYVYLHQHEERGNDDNKRKDNEL